MSFLVGKILINIRILQDPFFVEISLIRVNRGMRDISLHRYSWRWSQAMLDPLTSSPRWSLASSESSRRLYKDARQVSWGRQLLWCHCFGSRLLIGSWRVQRSHQLPCASYLEFLNENTLITSKIFKVFTYELWNGRQPYLGYECV